MAAACATLAALGAGAAPASADQAVVSATVYSGSGGVGPQTKPVMESLLANDCPLYDGPVTIPLSSGTEITVPSNSTWTLSTVLQCGLSIPPTDVYSLRVRNGVTNAFQAPLTGPEVFDPAAYPNGDGVLPLVSVNGGTTQTQYVRPALSATDDNAADNFTVDGPISIVVNERAAPLNVTITKPAAAAKTSASERVRLAATVTAADRAPVPSAHLTYAWSVNGATYSGLTPTVSIKPGVTIVSVEVVDQATGTGGTASRSVTYDPTGGTSHNNKPRQGSGGHNHGNNSGQTHGKRKSRGNRAPRQPQHQQPSSAQHTTTHHSSSDTTPSSSTTPSTATTTAPPPTSAPTTSTPATTPGLTPVNGRTKPPPGRHHHASRHHRHRTATTSHRAARSGASSGLAAQLVTGRLVADIEPVPPSSSPLVRNAKASEANVPLVHAATTSPAVPTWLYATLAVVALLIGGAVYERRGRRGRSLHR